MLSRSHMCSHTREQIVSCKHIGATKGQGQGQLSLKPICSRNLETLVFSLLFTTHWDTSLVQFFQSLGRRVSAPNECLSSF